MTDIIIIAIVACIVCTAGWYIIKAKKSGRKCIGCPDSGSCGGSCGSCSHNCGHSCGCRH